MGQHGYEVSQQWQSRFDELRVISDKKGGYSTLRLAKDPKLLHRLQKTVATDVKFVHVVRNPTTTSLPHSSAPQSTSATRL